MPGRNRNETTPSQTERALRTNRTDTTAKQEQPIDPDNAAFVMIKNNYSRGFNDQSFTLELVRSLLIAVTALAAAACMASCL